MLKRTLFVLLFVLAASPVMAQAQPFQTTALVDLRPLGLTRPYILQPIEFDGQPGEELLVWLYADGQLKLFSPHAAGGPCLSAVFTPVTPRAFCASSNCQGWMNFVAIDVLPFGAPDGIKDLLIYSTINPAQPVEVAAGRAGNACAR